MNLHRILLTLFVVILTACGKNEPINTMRDSNPVPAEIEPAETVPEEQVSTRPRWLPDAIVLPDDFEQISDNAIGRFTKIMSGETSAEPDALLAKYREALTSAGYQVTDTADQVEQGIVFYTGNGFESASIRFVQDEGILQFDATLEEK